MTRFICIYVYITVHSLKEIFVNANHKVLKVSNTNI